MTLSAKEIRDFKTALEKEHGREFTDEETMQTIRYLESFAEMHVEMLQEEQRRRTLLNDHPEGFHLDRNGYSCLICGGSASEKNSWYDKHGLKCMLCQKAINSGAIPVSIAKNEESWYSKQDLETLFNIKGADLNRYIKQGILKDRIVPGIEKKVHLQLFLIKENKDVLPPKKLFKSRTVKVMRNGEEYFSQEHWYEFADIKFLKRLQKYKIIDCLKETFSKPMYIGHPYYKEINPIFTHNNL